MPIQAVGAQDKKQFPYIRIYQPIWEECYFRKVEVDFSSTKGEKHCHIHSNRIFHWAKGAYAVTPFLSLNIHKDIKRKCDK